MKTLIKNLIALGIGALSLFMVTAASAQVRVGVGIGLGYGGYYPRGYYYNPYGRYYGYAYPRVGLSIGVLPYGYMPFYFGPSLYYYSNGVYYSQYSDNSYHVVAPPVGAEVPQLPTHTHAIMINGLQYFERNGVYYKLNAKPDGTYDYVIAGKDGVLSTNVVPTAPQPGPPPQMQPAPAPQQAQPVPQQAPVPIAPQTTTPEMQLPPPPTGNAPTGNAPTAPEPKTGDIVAQLPDGCKAVSVAGKKYFVNPDDVYYEEFNDNGKVSYRVAGTPNDQPTKQ